MRVCDEARNQILENLAIDYVSRYTDHKQDDIRPGKPRGEGDDRYVVPIIQKNVPISPEDGRIRKPETWVVILDSTGSLVQIR